MPQRGRHAGAPHTPGAARAGRRVAALDAGALRLRTVVGGRAVQEVSTVDTVFDVGALLSSVTRRTPLRPGEALLTGSPTGVGPLVPGDRVEVRIEGVGTPANPVAGTVPPGIGCPSGSGDV
ncbi:fumarylacetoacetate hydrolase family protein [Streptomyces sp. NPDC002514]|uniref:fumarylacetoacetate hydrolase family protein n=1 Tax=unclassified Streptomyces TaxID=2593676 RepID=UPI00368771C1